MTQEIRLSEEDMLVLPYALCSMRHACYSTGVLCHLPSALCRLFFASCLKRSAPFALCRIKLVLRLDVGRWSRILRVWEIV
jgi:hypothetical protein